MSFGSVQRRAVVGIAVCLAGLGVAGCRDAAKDDAKRTVERYYLAVSRKDPVACRYLGPHFRLDVQGGKDLIGEVDRKRCSLIYGPARKFLAHPLTPKDLDIEVSHSEDRMVAVVRMSSRFAPLTSPVGIVEQLILQRSHGRWRIFDETT